MLYKVLIPMFTSPMIGFVAGALLMTGLYFLVVNWKPGFVNSFFGKAQLISAGYMGFSHGSNDAQKTMGIIALALFSATKAGELVNLPDWCRAPRACRPCCAAPRRRPASRRPGR